MNALSRFRKRYHEEVCAKAIFLKHDGVPSIADVGSNLSVQIAQQMIEQIGAPLHSSKITGQTAGKHFEDATKAFLEAAFGALSHLRPGKWTYSVQGSITDFAQYAHLATLAKLIQSSKELRTTLGSYVVKPDIVIGRMPFTDEEINERELIVEPDSWPKLTPARSRNRVSPLPIAPCEHLLQTDIAKRPVSKRPHRRSQPDPQPKRPHAAHCCRHRRTYAHPYRFPCVGHWGHRLCVSLCAS